MKNIIIDCDPGLDDAVALLAAFGAPELNILAITTVAGNVKAFQTAKNALTICGLTGTSENVPICSGAPLPLFRDPVTAEDFHGTTGLGGIDFPEPVQKLSEDHAVNKMIQICSLAKPDSMTVILTGPMTNFALALRLRPEISAAIAEIILMGGANTEGGNITPYAEFNVFADPHAAAIVFASGIPIRCLSLDVTHQIRTTQKRLHRVRSIQTPQAKAVADLLESSCKLEFSANGAREAPLHDPSTIIALLRPDLFEGRRADVAVVTQPGEQFGRTVPSFHKDGPVLWYETVDDDAVFETLDRLLEAY